MSINKNGVVVWRGASEIDGAPIVMIVTGLTSKSQNSKTGAMMQTWILREDMDPMEAMRQNVDVSICGACLLRQCGSGSVECVGCVQSWVVS